MSKIGKKPIIIPDNLDVKINDGFLELKKDNNILKIKTIPFIKIEIKDKNILFNPENNSKQAMANWGTIRAIVNNAVIGLISGFQKKLEIEGVGYRVNMEKDNLILNIGYSHSVKFVPPEGVKVSTDKNVITVSGINKALVGETAAKIRAIKKPEPYKGKGIKYQGEIIRRKAGKKVTGAGK